MIPSSLTALLPLFLALVQGQEPNCPDSSANYVAHVESCLYHSYRRDDDNGFLEFDDYIVAKTYRCVNGVLTGDLEKSLDDPDTVVLMKCPDEMPYCSTCGTGRAFCRDTVLNTDPCPDKLSLDDPLVCSKSARYTAFTYETLDDFSTRDFNETCVNGTKTITQIATTSCPENHPYYTLCDGMHFCSAEKVECSALNPPFRAPDCTKSTVNYDYYTQTCLDGETIQDASGYCADGELKLPTHHLTTCNEVFEGTKFCNDCGQGQLVCSNLPASPKICQAASERVCPFTMDGLRVHYGIMENPCRSSGEYSLVYDECTEDGNLDIFNETLTCGDTSGPHCANCPGPDGSQYDMCLASGVPCDTLNLFLEPRPSTPTPPAVPTDPSSAPVSVQVEKSSENNSVAIIGIVAGAVVFVAVVVTCLLCRNRRNADEDTPTMAYPGAKPPPPPPPEPPVVMAQAVEVLPDYGGRDLPSTIDYKDQGRDYREVIGSDC